MKVSKLESDQRFKPVKNTVTGVITYGESSNDYPQKIREMLAASVTGSSCNRVYKSFVTGLGFTNKEKVNDQDLDSILPLIVDDLCSIGGFAIWVNWNSNLEVSSIEHVPFEFVRFGLNGGFKIHPDWARRNTQVKQFDAKDIINVKPFNPDNVLEEVEEAGGWDFYSGQLYYFSNRGPKCYPLAIFDSATTDLVTEESIADITYHNSTHNFLPSGFFINVSNDSDVDDEINDVVRRLQGSKNANKIACATVRNKDEIPEFVSMEGSNYDSSFTVSREAAKNNIIRAFGIPPILVGENVASGFSHDLIENAYNFYNAVTSTERETIKNAFTTLYPNYDWTIIPLQYGETQIENKESIVEVVAREDINVDRKAAILKYIYKLNDETISNILGIQL